jgi:hypothetical protein
MAFTRGQFVRITDAGRAWLAAPDWVLPIDLGCRMTAANETGR